MIVQNSKIFKVSFGKQKFFGFFKVRNHSRNIESGIGVDLVELNSP